MPPRRCGRQNTSIQQHEHNKIPSRAKGKDRKTETQQKEHLRDSQQFVVRVASVVSTFVVGLLVPCYPVCRLLPALVNRGFPTTATPPLPIPLDATHNGSAPVPTQFRLVVVRNTSDRERSREVVVLYLVRNKEETLVGKIRKDKKQTQQVKTTTK